MLVALVLFFRIIMFLMEVEWMDVDQVVVLICSLAFLCGMFFIFFRPNPGGRKTVCIALV